MAKPFARFLSGALLGGAIVGVSLAAAPRSAAAQNTGFCSDTGNYLCCCSTRPDGTIIQCACQSKPPQPTDQQPTA